MKRPALVCLFACALFFSDSTTFAEADSRFTVVALRGEPAPGAPGKTFADLYPISINNAGQVMFGASLDAVDPKRDLGIWYGKPGELELVVRRGDAAPGAAGREFSGFYYPDGSFRRFHLFRPTHNDAGQLVFVGYLEGDDPYADSGLWVGRPGALELVALSGEPAPGLAERTFLEFLNPMIDDAGNVLFQAVLDDFSTGLWYFGPDGLVPISARGMVVPGLPDGPTYRGLGNADFSLSPTGEMAFYADIANDDSAIVAGPPDALQAIARFGDSAPGAPEATLRTMNKPRAFAGGAVMFRASLRSDDPSDGAIYYGTPDSLKIVARNGEPAPGTDANYRGAVGFNLDANTAGEVLFVASLSEFPQRTDNVLLSGLPGAIERIARTDDPAPGTTGLGFGHAGGRRFRASISDAGKILFATGIPPSGTTSSWGNGLWLVDDEGTRAIALPGETFEVRPGDERLITNVRVLQSADEFGAEITSGMNANHQLAFRLDFRGLTQAHVVTVDDEPGDVIAVIAETSDTECVNDAGAVPLDGSQSRDGSSPASCSWRSDLCAFDDATSCTPLATCALGFSDVELTAAGSSGASAVTTATVNVVDTTPPSGGILAPSDGACLGPDEIPVVINANFSDVCDGDLEPRLDPAGPYHDHGAFHVEATAADRAGLTASDSVEFTIDLVPPVVTLLEPRYGALIPEDRTKPVSVMLESHDDDGAPGGVVRERVLLKDCVLFDGAYFGDGDGLLVDEEIDLTEQVLCEKAAACGLDVVEHPTLTVESYDCAGNRGTAVRTWGRKSAALYPGLCTDDR